MTFDYSYDFIHFMDEDKTDIPVQKLSLLVFKIMLFIHFTSGCAGSPLLCCLFSGCGEQGLLSTCGQLASHCSGFS